MEKNLIEKNTKVEARKSKYKEEYNKLLAISQKSLAKIKTLDKQLVSVETNEVVDDTSRIELKKLKQACLHLLNSIDLKYGFVIIYLKSMDKIKGDYNGTC